MKICGQSVQTFLRKRLPKSVVKREPRSGAWPNPINCSRIHLFGGDSCVIMFTSHVFCSTINSLLKANWIILIINTKICSIHLFYSDLVRRLSILVSVVSHLLVVVADAYLSSTLCCEQAHPFPQTASWIWVGQTQILPPHQPNHRTKVGLRRDHDIVHNSRWSRADASVIFTSLAASKQEAFIILVPDAKKSYGVGARKCIFEVQSKLEEFCCVIRESVLFMSGIRRNVNGIHQQPTRKYNQLP